MIKRNTIKNFISIADFMAEMKKLKNTQKKLSNAGNRISALHVKKKSRQENTHFSKLGSLMGNRYLATPAYLVSRSGLRKEKERKSNERDTFEG